MGEEEGVGGGRWEEVRRHVFFFLYVYARRAFTLIINLSLS